MSHHPVRLKTLTLVLLAAVCGGGGVASAQSEADVLDVEDTVETDVGDVRESPPYRRFHVGGSLFMLMNLVPDEEAPYFANINFGVHLTPKDVLTFEALTWRYYAPLGVPHGPEKGAPRNRYPGYARDIGVGVYYQRFLWRGAYVGLHATPFYQTYHEPDGTRIQSGFQLFMTARAGYHFAFAKNRVFIEPSIAVTAWPINTNQPDSFAAQEEGWPGYFLAEPGLHAGVKF